MFLNLFRARNDEAPKLLKKCCPGTGLDRLLITSAGIYFILFGFCSCIRLSLPEDDNISAEGSVIYIVTKNTIGHATVKILEWHTGILWGAPYYIEKDSCLTDQTGYFAVSDDAKTKFNYTLMVTAPRYFKDEGYPITVNTSNRVNISLFPHGYIKSHIINKIDTAKFIEIFFTPYYNSEGIFRDGFINTSILVKAFADTTVVTTTVGGILNELLIKIYSDYEDEVRTVTDTSFLTRRHDTLQLDNIVLK